MSELRDSYGRKIIPPTRTCERSNAGIEHWQHIWKRGEEYYDCPGHREVKEVYVSFAFPKIDIALAERILSTIRDMAPGHGMTIFFDEVIEAEVLNEEMIDDPKGLRLSTSDKQTGLTGP